MGRIARVLVALSVVVATVVVASPGSQAATSAERNAELWIIHLVNRDRVDTYNLGTLLENDGLRAGAEAHSLWLRQNGYGTAAFDGKDPHDGFNTRFANFQSSDPGAGGMCENVAMVSGSIYKSYRRAAKALYELWVNALDGHNQCLYDKPLPPSNTQLHTTVVGVGVKKVRHRWYATYDAGEDSSPSS